MDLQPSSLLPPLSVCNRLDLHDRLPHPCRSRSIPHGVACLEDTRYHEPDIFPYAESLAPIRPESSDCPRSSAHSSRGKCPGCFESLFSLTWISVFGDVCNSRLLWPRKSVGLRCLRPTGGRTGLSILGWALYCYSHVSRLASHSSCLGTSYKK